MNNTLITIANYSHVKFLKFIGNIPNCLKNNPNAKLIRASDGGLRSQSLAYLQQYGVENGIKLLGLREEHCPHHKNGTKSGQ